MTHAVALSGGKDSTAMALRLVELNGPQYEFICTPTGDELPEMEDHWARLECMLDAKLTRIENPGLDTLINHFNALPNWRMRWCTRMLKIEPCIAWLRQRLPVTLYVGLRADEEERRGIYGDHGAEVRFPLREWGWGLREVKQYLLARGIAIPRRTDCARCYDQRLSEWYELWREYPHIYQDAEAQEVRTGKTFRSPQRDAWPAALCDLRRRFAHGDKPRGTSDQRSLFEPEREACRVCKL